jgi:hypothetical protein
MSKWQPKFKAHRDQNHRSIVADLEKAGIHTRDCAAMGGGFTDIITYWHPHTVFQELKFETDARVKKSQLHFLATWPGWCGIACSLMEATRLAQHPERYALTAAEKEVLLHVWVNLLGDKISLGTVYKHLARVKAERHDDSYNHI